MEYLTGIHALNLVTKTDTPGDWHRSALRWKNLTINESNNSIYKNWGIESGHTIPEHTQKFYVANHLRALLDLIDNGKFNIAQGMNRNFIDNPIYDMTIFKKVYELRNNSNWNEINNFMHKEYGKQWRLFNNE
jgi:hypothetical protein